MVSAAAFMGTGRHRAPYWTLRHIGQAAILTGLAAAIPAALVYSGGGKARVIAPPAAPPAQAVAAAGAVIRPGHQIQAAHQVAIQFTYQVRRHDSLSAIAAHQLGSSKLWPELWWLNRHRVHNPMVIPTGLTLKLVPLPPQRERYVKAAMAAIPPPPPPPAPAQAVTGAAPANAPVAAAAPVTYSGGSGFQACVIARESGGNSQVMNSTGHYGLYQFSSQTWAAYGGNPADFGNASVAEQNQVFSNAMATPGGASNWSPYDGC